MSTITTRAGKGSALSWIEADANFTNLNIDKLEVSVASSTYATQASIANMIETSDIGVSVQAYSSNLSSYATVNPTPAGLALLDDANAASQRTTLGAQEVLVSGVNIKTVNGSTILGTGDIIFAVADGDKGDITVSSSGAVWTVDSAAITPTKLSQPLTLMAAQATTSGTSVDFTSIPSWARRITIMFTNISASGTSSPQVQIGDSGGIETTGYLGSASLTTSSIFTGGFGITNASSSASFFSGIMNIVLLDTATNTWSANSLVGYSNAAGTAYGAGSKALSGTLDRIRLTTVNGTDTFDSGTINVMYE